MNTNDEHSRPDPLDANLSKLICKENLPPVPTEETKAAMLEKLRGKQAALAAPPVEERKIIRFSPRVLGGWAAAAAVVALLGGAFFDLSWMFGGSTAGPDEADPAIVGSAPEITPGDGDTPPVIIDPAPPEIIPEPIAYDATDETRRIELRDGSTAIAEQGTRFVEVAPRQLRLESGSLYLLVAKAATPLEVETPQGKVLALGTRFLVSSQEADTRVAVAQGSVQLVRNDDAQLVLNRGEEGVLAPAELTRRPAPRLSHLVSWARGSLRASERVVGGDAKQRGLIVVDPQGQESRLTLREYTLDIFIENGVARTTIDQTFFNHHHSNTEGTFYFPLPPGAAVSRLAMYVNGVRNEGGMVERKRGQQIYNDIKYQNRDPALLEQLEGNLYKLRIFPLEGRQEKRIFLSFTQTVDELYRTLGYWFPMDHTHDNAGVVRIKVRIKHGEELYDAESSTHDFVKTVEDGDLVLSYEAKNTKPDDDLLLKLVPKFVQTDLAETAVLKRAERRFLHTRIRPELEGQQVDPQPRQWFVLNDCSASRSAADLEAQAHIIERLLAEGDDGDRIAIANLNIDAERLMGGPVLLDDEAAKQAVEKVRGARRIGGTNLEAGIALMRDWIASSGAQNPHLVYLGDGLATDGAATSRELTALLDKKVPFLGIAVGKKTDLSALRDAANATGGGAYLMNPDEDLNWRVFDLLAAMNTPRLTDLHWEFPGDPEDVVSYSDRGTLAAGEALTIVAASNVELPSQVTIRGLLNGAPWEQVVALDPDREDAGFIPRFWAQRHVEELLKDGETHREEVVRLSQKHYVATPFTSLIVLENDKMYKDYKVEKGRTDHWAAYPAPDKIPVVREPLPWFARSWDPTPAGQLVDDSRILLDPKTAEEILDTLLPPPSGRVVDRSVSATDRVRRHLYRGEGYYNLGRFDNALMEFEAVLRIDPYNSAARRWMERISSARSDYYRAAYDETRARLLMEVDQAWEQAVPSVPIPVIPSENVTGSWIDSGNGGGGSFRGGVDAVLGGRPGPDAIMRNSMDAIIVPTTRLTSVVGDFTPSKAPLPLPTPPPVGFTGRGLGGNLGVGSGLSWNPLWGEAAIPVGREVAGRKYRGRFSYHPSYYSFVGSLPTTIAALGNSASDRVSAVEMTLGREKRGRITEAAAALVRAAEAKRQPVRLGETIITPDGRMKSRGSSPMYLEEEIVSDGRKWFHIYRELGFATCRPVTPSNLAVIQSVVPHWPPSLKELEARWTVTLAGQDEDSFEIVLDDPNEPSRKTALKISADGRLLKSRQWQGDKLVATRNFRYEGNTVVVADEGGFSQRYEAVEIEVAEALFVADLDELVVLDLPLRKPAFYEKQLAEAVKGTDAVKKQLLRHIIIAKLLDGRLVAPPVPVKGTAQKPLDAKSAWTRLIQLGAGSTPVFDHRTLAAAVDISSAVPEGSDFLAHFKDASTLSRSGSPTLAQVKAFIDDWPDSPYVLSVLQRCADRRAWVALLDLARYRSLAIDRIALDAEVQSWPDRAALATRIADFLVADAEEGRPAVVIPAVARFLGREQQDNASWRKVVDSYREAAGELEALDTRSVVAILDLAIKEKDGALEQRCLDLLLQAMMKPREITVLANMFAHHGRHEKAVGLYKKALAGMEEPDAGLLQQASQSARQVDEMLSITWQRRALKSLGDSSAATNKQVLAHHYSELLTRTLAAGELAVAMELALEGYELLPAQHSLVTTLATYFHERGRETERWRWLSTIIDRNPKNAEASGAIGGWYDHQELLIKADAMFAAAHAYDSAHPQWLVMRASALYRAGQFEEADTIYRELTTTPWAYQLKSQVPAKFRLFLSDPGKIGLLTSEDPGEGWADPDFDDRDWEKRTTRFTADHSKSPLWDAPFHTRQKFQVARIPRQIDLQAGVHGAECEVYLNGVLVQRLKEKGANSNGADKPYTVTLSKEIVNNLRIGENILAVRYKKTGKSPRAYVELMQLFERPE